MIQVHARAGNAAEILIYDPIGEDWFGNGTTAKRFVQQLEALGDVSEILVRINSPGGEVFDGFAIYNAIKNHKARVKVQVDGLAASIASVIAMAGDEISMGAGAMMMIHDPWTIAWGDADDMRAVSEMLDKVKVGLVDAYVAKTKKPREQIEKWMTSETWFTAAESVAEGFADKTMVAADEPEGVPASALDRLSLPLMQNRFLRLVAAIATKSPGIRLSVPADAQQETGMDPAKTIASASQADIENANKVAVVAALAAEAERQRAIREAFGAHATEHRVLLDELLGNQTVTVDGARKRLLDKLGETGTPLRTPATPGVSDREKFVAGAVQAILFRSGIEKKREPGNEFNGMTLCALAAHALTLAGVSVRGMSNDAIARKVLALHSTSDFPLLLSNTAGKVLRAAYESFPNTYQQWCQIGQLSDFKIHPRIQMGSFNNLDLIPEQGEYTFGNLTEDAENISAKTKGKAINFSRQMLVNDDLGGFNRRAQYMGRAAARTVNVDAFALLQSGAGNNGPTMSDTGQLFNVTAAAPATPTGHANLTTGAGPPSVTTVATLRQRMRRQKDKGFRETLNIQPRILLYPVVLEETVWTLLNSTADPSSSNSNKRNYARDLAQLVPVSDPALDDVSATAWYLLSDPNDVPLIEVAFLDGNQTPFVDDELIFLTDSLAFKVRLDYGFAAIDWRAGQKHAGA